MKTKSFSLIVVMSVIISIICINAGCSVTMNTPLDESHSIENSECHAMMRMNLFFNRHYPDIKIKTDPNLLTKSDSINVDSGYRIIYYRFLSALSGLNTPYNDIDVFHRPIYTEYIYQCEDNIRLVNWYSRHQDMIDCDMFNEYYDLAKGILDGPDKRLPLDEFLDQVEVHYDSLELRLKIFEDRYSKYFNRSDDSSEYSN